jgi:hypothetical protein
VGAHGESARARGEGCSTSNNAVSLVVPCLDWSHSRSNSATSLTPPCLLQTCQRTIQGAWLSLSSRELRLQFCRRHAARGLVKLSDSSQRAYRPPRRRQT